MKRYILSRQELTDQLDRVAKEYGPDAQPCQPGGDPPCGGCVACVMAQVSHGWHEMRATASRYQAAGLEWAPGAIDWYAITGGPQQSPYHDWYGHMLAGEGSR